MSEEQPAETEQVSDLTADVEPQLGNAPPEALEQMRPVCSLAEQNYNQVVGLIKEIKEAEAVLQKFHSQEGGVTSEDLESAKNQFHQSKQSYLELGNQINDGMKQVYTMAQTWPDDLLVQNLYKTYLAKLLASLETRNPVQNFVELIAVGGFNLERRATSLTPGDEEDSNAVEKYEKREREETDQTITMLEVRYQKRQLANRLRQGENPAKVISRLAQLVRKDPDDINTHIWMANLVSGNLKTERDQNKRISLRDEVLDHCKKAFAIIDDYLNLQKIESLNERDRMRAEYVKTITSIRKPLLAQA